MNEYADIVTRLRKWESSSVREHEDALREAASAIESLRAENDGVSSLLAVLHGDGGHYESEHGRQKAIEDAAKVYYRLYERCGVLEAASVRVVEIITTNTQPFRVDMPAPIDARVSLEPGQSLAIIERSVEAAASVKADPTKVRWVDPVGSCWVQIPDEWMAYHKHGDVRVTLRPTGEKVSTLPDATDAARDALSPQAGGKVKQPDSQ